MTAAVLLATIALWAGGKPVPVTVEGFGLISGTAFVGGDHIWLTAPAYRLASQGDGVGVFMLLHETGHITGLKECDSDRFALGHLRAALHKFWPRLTRRALNARVLEAMQYPNYLTAPGYCANEAAQ